jgi:hypothetical protein
MGHFIETCKYCDTVISQCRCPSPNKEKRVGVCNNCHELDNDAQNTLLSQGRNSKTVE